MLYLSRYVVDGGTVCYGVVDTDDDVETIVSVSDLEDAKNSGVDIKGVAWGTSFNGVEEKKVVAGVKVVPISTSYSALQAKLKSMFGISVTTRGSMITCINWEPFKIGNNIAIPLSKLASSCADYMLLDIDFIGGESDSAVTLVIDDNIAFTPHSFTPDVPHRYRIYQLNGLRLDIRACSDIIAAKFYHGLVGDLTRIDETQFHFGKIRVLGLVNDLVIDDEKRKFKMMW